MRALPIVLAVASTALVVACGQAASHPRRHGLAAAGERPGLVPDRLGPWRAAAEAW